MTAVVLIIVLILHRDRLQQALLQLSKSLHQSRPLASLRRQDLNGLCILSLLFVVLLLELSWLAKHV